jgi:GT2 family glycosyltransferase
LYRTCEEASLRKVDEVQPPLISAIVVAYATEEKRPYLRECLAAIRMALQEVEGRKELILVLNNAGGTTSEAEARGLAPEAIVLVPGGNLGFAGGVVRAARHARGEWIALVNDDATVDPRAFVEMLAVARSSDDIGSVAAQIRFANRPDVINSAGIDLDRLGVACDRLLGLPAGRSESVPTEIFGASGGAALYRRSMLAEIGGFDASFFAYLEDVDVAWRARMMGWRCVYAPAALVHHHHSMTLGHRSRRKYFLVGRNRLRLLAKNASTRQLARNAAAILMYDLGYVVYVGARHRTLAPLQGRVRGLLEWRRYRTAGAPYRRSIELPPRSGFRAALERERSWAGRTASRTTAA